jgi:hypothetical protein
LIEKPNIGFFPSIYKFLISRNIKVVIPRSRASFRRA